MKSPDHAIDTLLTGLRNTPTPIGLEARVQQRLASRAAQLSTAPRRFAQQPRVAFAAVVTLLALASLAILNRQRQTDGTQGAVAPRVSVESYNSSVEIGGDSASQRFTADSAARPGTTHLVPRLSTRPQTSPSRVEGQDLDAIALAETLAPSRPTPPMPLTAQEGLLLRSTRQGQPIEVAELETRRDSVLNAIAEARQRAAVREYIHGLLAPLATAQTLTPSPSSDTRPAAADPESHPAQ